MVPAYSYNGHSLTRGLPAWAVVLIVAVIVIGIAVRLWLWRRASDRQP
jgi:hypothetical protein